MLSNILMCRKVVYTPCFEAILFSNFSQQLHLLLLMSLNCITITFIDYILVYMLLQFGPGFIITNSNNKNQFVK